MKHLLVLLSILWSWPALGQAVPAASKPDLKAIADFGADVLPFSKTDFHKWAVSPQLSCIGEAGDIAPCKPYVDRFISDINGVLSGLPIQIAAAPDNTANATFRVYIGRKAAIARARRANGVNSGSPGYVKWSNEKFITDYSLYIDLDEYTKWTPVEQRAALYRYMLDGIGYCGGPSIKGVASVYSSWWSEPILTEYDRKMIRFAYEHLPTGSSKSDIRQAVRKKWDLVQLPGQ
jgi:hypothetical protein